jgi:hypothetical protein
MMLSNCWRSKSKKKNEILFCVVCESLNGFFVFSENFIYFRHSLNPLLRKFRSIRNVGAGQNEDDKKLFRGGREIFWNRQKFEHSRAATLHRRNFMSSVNSVCYWSSSRPVSTTLFVRRVSDPLAFSWACCHWQHLRDIIVMGISIDNCFSPNISWLA